MGEAGGGLLGYSPSKTPLAGTGDTSPPAFAAPICIVFPAYSSFSVLRETPMAFSRDYFKKLNCDNLWDMEVTGQVLFTVRFGVEHVALLNQLELVDEKHDQETDQKRNER